MIDLQTLKGGSRAAIIEIGACSFDPFAGELLDIFEAFPEWEDATRYGEASGECIEWWFRQSPEARARQLHPPVERQPLAECLQDLRGWWPREGVAWGNGALFDLGVLKHAYEQVMGDENAAPWLFMDERDFRTVKEQGARRHSSLARPKRLGLAHSGVDDAVTQAVHVIRVYKALGLGSGLGEQAKGWLTERGYFQGQ